ncbi:zinc finger BED domain-containing protein RICESLEEPER 2-like [Neodiprion fabricii]|uniref:zinc finger BED domain-containing protein RICESLEEPER 2-like n=1 Tax=Neodiprion fabricii TaxID=2872261 RepID=UPI001ED90660|nr:zinc finger BED domain-containing protein RICESLEEPER 2-like [Neodiprion fabricii]
MDVSTRWNSTHVMLRTALSVKSALNALMHNYGELREMIINPEEWEIIEAVCAYLKPFDHLSTVLGGQTYITLPLGIVGFNMLLDKIETVTHQLDVKPSRSCVDEEFIEAFQARRDKMLKHYKKTNWIYGVVLILDPRHKVGTFQLTSWGRDIEKASMAKFQKIFREQYWANSTVEMIASQGKSLSDQGSQGSFDLYELYEASTPIFHEDCSEPQREFECYCKLKRASRNENILERWRNNSNSFPNLAKMARDFLSIPATSVPAERLFSKAGLILRKHRNNMSNESARSLLCLNGWLTCSLKSAIQKNLNPSEQ